MDNFKGHRQRLKERFLSKDVATFSEEILLELLLTYAIPQKDVSAVAKQLIKDLGSIKSVLAAPEDILSEYPLIKENVIILFKLFNEIQTKISEIEKLQHVAENLGNTSNMPADLFGIIEHEKVHYPDHFKDKRTVALFANAVVSDALEILPKLPLNTGIELTRKFIKENLRYNSLESRERYGSYITRRLFPSGITDNSIIKFAIKYGSTQPVRDAVFYRFLKAEPLMVKIIHDLLLPEIVKGEMQRDLLTRKLSALFPESKTIRKTVSTTIEVLVFAKMAKSTKKSFSFGLRDVNLASFAFVLLSEFPKPDMYTFEELQNNTFINGMFWKTERLIHMLYELRNVGIISKVSEIDNFRQFTTKYSLEDFVERLANGELTL